MLTERERVLVIDDDGDVRESLHKLLSLSGLPCLAMADSRQAIHAVVPDWPGVVVCDVRMPGMDGEQLLMALQQMDAQLPVILITGHGDIPMAIRAVRAGAFEFLEKPVAPALLIASVNRALVQRQETVENRRYLTQELNIQLLGKSVAMVQLREKLTRLASSDLTVFIVGEMGTGRRMVAEQLHRLGRNSQGPLVRLEAELLAPSTSNDEDAHWRNMYWDVAQSGTLLICHPERLPARLQALLCNWLLDNAASTSGRSVRVLAISEVEPLQAISEGQLRPDLFYLLSAARVNLPSLRQRGDDIALLFRHFVRQSCRRLRKPHPEIKKAFIDKLAKGDWPGNLQELRNVAEMYAIGLARIEGLGRTILIDKEQESLDEQIDLFEKKLIEDALSLFQGRVSATADYLHVPRKKLYLRMKKHGIGKESFKPGS